MRTKGFLLGLLVGIMLAVPVSVAGAEVVSMIGKQVEGSFPIYLDGARVEKDALVIERTSYVPIRVLAEMFNSDVSFIDSEILITPKRGEPVSALPQANPIAERNKELSEEVKQHLENIEKRREARENPVIPVEQQIEAIINRIDQLDNLITLHKGIREEKGIMDYDESISGWEAERDDLKAQLAALQDPEPTQTPTPTTESTAILEPTPTP